MNSVEKVDTSVGLGAIQSENSNLVKFVMCTLVSRKHMTFYVLTKVCTVPGNQGTHVKPNQVRKFIVFKAGTSFRWILLTL